jgi:hypothetical protein
MRKHTNLIYPNIPKYSNKMPTSDVNWRIRNIKFILYENTFVVDLINNKFTLYELKYFSVNLVIIESSFTALATGSHTHKRLYEK